MICLPRIAFLSSFGRETSLVNIIGPQSIFSPLFTPSIYFPFLLSSCSHYYLPFVSFVNNKAEGIDNPSVLVGSKVTFCLCKSTSTSYQPATISGAVDTYLYLCESYGSITLVSLPREISATLHLSLPLGVTNEGRDYLYRTVTATKR